jgi:dipeptidyl aminopeptidase/acylaminoacyl peptidase
MNTHIRRLLLTLLVCVFALGLQAQTGKRAFTIEDIYRLKNIDGLKISPDGKTIVFSLTTSDLARAKRQTHLWAMDVDGTNLRQLTFSDKSEGSPSFSPDGKTLAFVSKRDGDENIYLMSMSGGEARKLTDISTGIADPVWSPDGKTIIFASDVYPECGGDDACNKKISDRWSDGPLKAHMADALLYRHWTSWKDGTRTHIFLADTTTGKVRDLTPGDFDSPPFQLGGAVDYDFSPDGKELVFVRNPDKQQASSTNADLWLLPLDGSQGPRNISEANKSYDGNPQYSPDGRFIAYRRQSKPAYESDLFQIAVYDRKQGTTRVLTPTFDNWIDDFTWAPDSQSIYFTGEVKGLTPIYNVTLDGKMTKVLDHASIDSMELSKDGQTLVFASRSVGTPQELFSVAVNGTKTGEPKRISHNNDALANEVDIRPAEEMWVDGALGEKVQVYIVKPHGFDPSKKYPLILNVHGGPQSQFGDAFRADWQVYPGAGYVVAFANPHGSTGSGQAYTAQISGDFGGAVFEDLMKVTDALEKLPYVDKNRMGAMGWSYGGYMMDWFEGHTDRFKAIASMMGIYDLRSFYGATEELWFPEWDLRGQPWNSADYEKFSPSSYVKNFKTPALIISGERDYRVPYTQSLQFFTALQKMGVPSRVMIYSNAGHWPSWYEMALYYTAHLEWFHQYLGGEAAIWSSEAFLRNAVFDKSTGKRIEGETVPGKRSPEPENPEGKPDQKPKQ